MVKTYDSQLTYKPQSHPEEYFTLDHPVLMAEDVRFKLPNGIIKRYSVDWEDPNVPHYVGSIQYYLDSIKIKSGGVESIGMPVTSCRWTAFRNNKGIFQVNPFPPQSIFAGKYDDDINNSLISQYLSIRVQAYHKDRIGLYSTSSTEGEIEEEIEDMIRRANLEFDKGDEEGAVNELAYDAYSLFSQIRFNRSVDDKLTSLFNKIF